MTPIKFNLPDHVSGDTFDGMRFVLTLNDVPMDITDAVIVLTAVGESDTIVLDNDAVTPEIAIIDAPNGIFEISKQIITGISTSYTYSIKITFDSGDIKTYIYGGWTIYQI